MESHIACDGEYTMRLLTIFLFSIPPVLVDRFE